MLQFQAIFHHFTAQRETPKTKPGQSRQDFSGRKNPQHAFLRRGSKAIGAMS